ncbi:hypothetical protein PVAP13_3NG225763 [Panicum virgatum]|uniref:Uncharacterized protein n=1 Tax=Panicum virgatum TaxID=38727 RepID=A0A8T0UEJ6_PANVG|nr:hypothetical protein PVAP13_3NG225763 [Panicum virgatum]
MENILRLYGLDELLCEQTSFSTWASAIQPNLTTCQCVIAPPTREHAIHFTLSVDHFKCGGNPLKMANLYSEIIYSPPFKL